VEIWAINPPGREVRLEEPPFARMEPLVNDLAKAIRPHLDVPFAFFGHSGGALVAFELARRLRRDEGLGPQHLFASASAAPHLRSRNGYAGRSDAELLAMLNELGTIPAGVAQEAELLELFMPALRADLDLIERYEYRAEEPLESPITALRGTADPVVSAAEVAAWEEHTNSVFTAVEMDGDHFFISAERCAVAGIVRRAVLAHSAQAFS
jgi:surfactin synthase thioesterase subunit